MKKLLLSSLAAALLAGCATSGNFDSQNALEHWNRYHAETISSTQLQDNQARVVFYRDDSLAGEGVNVFVNGDYQASLLANSFSPVAVCSNKPLFSASRVTTQKFGNRVNGVRHSLTEGETYYFKLVESAKGFDFVAVPAEQAVSELAALKGEIRHTLPRTTAKACDTEGESRTLSASALWGLNKHSYADMLAKGKQEIAEFADYVKGNDSIIRIEVSGFTDPEASEAYNLALSQRRADTVRQALVKAGVRQPIQATGYGETQLVVSDCAEQHPNNRQAKAACNQPNRRVEITTYTK